MRLLRGIGLLAGSALVLFSGTPNRYTPLPPSAPLSFERNTGQTSAGIDFVARPDGYNVGLMSDRLLMRPTGNESVAMVLVGSNRLAKAEGVSPCSRTAGDFARVRYREVYPGIDLFYYGTADGRLEYDFIVHSGADPSAIELEFEGAAELSLLPDGSLAIDTEATRIEQLAPVIYQQGPASGRQRIEGRYVKSAPNRVRFELGEYDSSLALVIDPVVQISSMLGGSGRDVPSQVLVDEKGAVWVMGSTDQVDFPTPATGSPRVFGRRDVFLTRLVEEANADGESFWRLALTAIIGGSGDDVPSTLGIDPASGDLLVTLVSNSPEIVGDNQFRSVRARLRRVPSTQTTAAALQSKDAVLPRRYLGSGTPDPNGPTQCHTIPDTQPEDEDLEEEGQADVSDEPVADPTAETETVEVSGQLTCGTFDLSWFSSDGSDPASLFTSRTDDDGGEEFVGDLSVGLPGAKSSRVTKVTRSSTSSSGNPLFYVTVRNEFDNINLPRKQQVVCVECNDETGDLTLINEGAFDLDLAKGAKAYPIGDSVFMITTSDGFFIQDCDTGNSFDSFTNFLHARLNPGASQAAPSGLDARYFPLDENLNLQTRVPDGMLEVVGNGDDRWIAAGEFGARVLVAGDSNSTDIGAPFVRFGADLPGAKAAVKEPTRKNQGGPDSDVMAWFYDTEAGETVDAGFFGGAANELVTDATVDAQGNLIIVGTTDGAIPTTANSISAAYGGGASDVFVMKIKAADPPALAADGVVGAADFLNEAIAPGSILSVFGPGGPPPVTLAELNSDGEFPAGLAGVRVLFDGIPGRMIFTAPNQSNVIAPFALVGRTTTMIQLEIGGELSNAVEMSVQPSRPQLFTASQTGTGQAALLNQDFSVNSAANPAAIGEVVQIFLTGGGQTDPPGSDGALAPTAEPLPRFADVQVFIGGVEAQVFYGGGAPGLVHGVGQVNVVVPDGVQPGPEVLIEVVIGGVRSRAGVTLAIE